MILKFNGKAKSQLITQSVMVEQSRNWGDCRVTVVRTGSQVTRVRLISFLNQVTTVPTFSCQSMHIRQQPVGSTILTWFTLFKFSGKYKMFGNSQNTILSCVCHSNISIKWLQEILP